MKYTLRTLSIIVLIGLSLFLFDKYCVGEELPLPTILINDQIWSVSEVVNDPTQALSIMQSQDLKIKSLETKYRQQQIAQAMLDKDIAAFRVMLLQIALFMKEKEPNLSKQIYQFLGESNE